jgi:hypothetical protein
MAIAAAYTAYQSGTQAVSIVQGLIDNDKDPERFATAQQWYQRAIQGDAVALCLLKYMSGRYGAAPGTGCGGTAASGFATQAAKDYCGKLYDQALAVIAGQVSAGTPISSPPSGPSQTISQVLTSAGTAATEAGYAIQGQASPAQKIAIATEIGKWALILGGLGAIAYLVMRSRGR